MVSVQLSQSLQVLFHLQTEFIARLTLLRQKQAALLKEIEKKADGVPRAIKKQK